MRNNQESPVDLERIGIQPPPDEIFKYRERRINVAQQVIERGGGQFIPDHGEYVEGLGTFIHYKGYQSMPAPEFAQRNVTIPDAVAAIAAPKRDFMDWIKMLASKELRLPIIVGMVGRKKRINKLLKLFNERADVTLLPFYMKDGYYCPLVKEIRIFAESMLVTLGAEQELAHKTAEIIGCFFEYDNAYRWRLQDVLTEANISELIYNLPKEVAKLLRIVLERDPNSTAIEEKFQSGARLLRYMWYVPSIKRGIQEALGKINLDNMKLDESDIYHTLLYSSYNVRGKTLQERVNIYEDKYGKDIMTQPPRVQVRRN